MPSLLLSCWFSGLPPFLCSHSFTFVPTIVRFGMIFWCQGHDIPPYWRGMGGIGWVLSAPWLPSYLGPGRAGCKGSSSNEGWRAPTLRARGGTVPVGGTFTGGPGHPLYLCQPFLSGQSCQTVLVQLGPDIWVYIYIYGYLHTCIGLSQGAGGSRMLPFPGSADPHNFPMPRPRAMWDPPLPTVSGITWSHLAPRVRSASSRSSGGY